MPTQKKLRAAGVGRKKKQSPFGNKTFGGSTFGGRKFGGQRFGKSSRRIPSGVGAPKNRTSPLKSSGFAGSGGRSPRAMLTKPIKKDLGSPRAVNPPRGRPMNIKPSRGTRQMNKRAAVKPSEFKFDFKKHSADFGA